MTLYRETPCEHGKVRLHELTGMHRLVARDEGRPTVCPGGSREEVVVDYAAALEQLVIGTDGEYGNRDWAKVIVDAALYPT